MAWTKEQVVTRAIGKINEGQIVNLGIGMPTLMVE